MSPAKVVLQDLTVPWDSANSFKVTLDRKRARYERLALNLVSNMPLDIGCRQEGDRQEELLGDDLQPLQHQSPPESERSSWKHRTAGLLPNLLGKEESS